MIFSDLAKTLPDYAKDQRLNVSSLIAEQLLTDQQKWGTFVACAHACGYKPLVDAVEAEAADKLTPEAMNAAKAAASVMAMNNIYYRFTHLVGNEEFTTMRAGLRMNVMANPGCDKLDFELASLAVSAVNGCGMCMESHEKTLQKHSVPSAAIQSAVRIAAVLHAVAVTLEQAAATA